MQKLFNELYRRLSSGEGAVLCSIIAASGSVPRGAGAKMLVFADGSTLGTVGGGSVELNARQKGIEILASKRNEIVPYSLNKAEVGNIGMICGGNVKVYFRHFTPADAELANSIAEQAGKNEDSFLIYRITGEGLCDINIAKAGGDVPSALKGIVEPLLCGAAVYKKLDGFDLFIEPLSKKGRALIFGAGHVARALTPVLKSIGLPVYVYDSREALLSREYLNEADMLIQGDFSSLAKNADIARSDAVFVMTPGHEADYEVLAQVLLSDAHYIGCIGSRHKAAMTRERLRLAGFSQQSIDRVRCPIGFNIGAQTPAEIAISIAAELISVNSGYSGVIPWPTAEEGKKQ